MSAGPAADGDGHAEGDPLPGTADGPYWSARWPEHRPEGWAARDELHAGRSHLEAESTAPADVGRCVGLQVARLPCPVSAPGRRSPLHQPPPLVGNAV